MAPEPEWRVGWASGERTFENVLAGTFMPDGRVVVADGRRTLEVLVFSPRGQVESVFGGPGEGPGEFVSIYRVVAMGDDTIAVQDERRARLSLFRGGRFIRRLDMRDLNLTILGLDGQGRLLLGPSPPMMFGRLHETPWLRVPLVRWAPELGTADTVRLVDSDMSLLFGGRNPVAPDGHVVVAGGRWVAGRGDVPELRWIDPDGRVHQIMRWDASPRPLSPKDRARIENGFRELAERSPEAAAMARRAVTEDLRGPLPYFGGMLADDHGRIWLQEFRLPTTNDPLRYHVVSEDGTWLGIVEMPRSDGLKVLAIRGDRVLTVEKDDFFVQAVAVYRLTW